MTNVSNLADAMKAAGFKTNRALAKAAGVSDAAVGLILKRGTCNGMTAEKLQAACGEHKIGPLLQPNTPAATEMLEADLLAYDDIRFEGSAWYRDVVNERVVVTGTRIIDGLVTWGASVFTTGGEVLAEDFRYSSHWPAQRWGKATARQDVIPDPRDAELVPGARRR